MIFTLTALVGVTLIIVRGTLFERVRRLWPALLECSQCTGTWVGVVVGASGVVSAGSSGYGRVIDAVMLGASTSLFSLLTDAVLLRLLGDPEGKDPCPDENSKP